MSPAPLREPRINALGQPVGWPLPDWRPAATPPRDAMAGWGCRVERLDPARHGNSLFAAYGEDRDGRNWTYLPYGPFADAAAFAAWLESIAGGADPLFHSVLEETSGAALGIASYLRIVPDTGVIEVGHINFAPRLQKTRLATAALYLMMRRVFEELGYRRYEWKCDALNAPSRAAAERLGFSYEGLFRQATIYKGRNRDTAWYSILDREWPALKRAYEAWLDPANFDAGGGQLTRLADLIALERRAA